MNERNGRTQWTNAMNERNGRTQWTNAMKERNGKTQWTNATKKRHERRKWTQWPQFLKYSNDQCINVCIIEHKNGNTPQTQQRSSHTKSGGDSHHGHKSPRPLKARPKVARRKSTFFLKKIEEIWPQDLYPGGWDKPSRPISIFDSYDITSALKGQKSSTTSKVDDSLRRWFDIVGAPNYSFSKNMMKF